MRVNINEEAIGEKEVIVTFAEEEEIFKFEKRKGNNNMNRKKEDCKPEN